MPEPDDYMTVGGRSDGEQIFGVCAGRKATLMPPAREV
jgi:hypothetical protein